MTMIIPDKKDGSSIRKYVKGREDICLGKL